MYKRQVGDITLADYWGLANVHPEFYDGKGVSAVIVNTQKGIDTWNKVKDELEYIEKLKVCIEQRNALILEKQNTVVGVMAFSYDTGSIEFIQFFLAQDVIRHICVLAFVFVLYAFRTVT